MDDGSTSAAGTSSVSEGGKNVSKGGVGNGNASPSRMQRLVRILILLIVVGGAVYGTLAYRESMQYPSTDNSYVQANLVPIAPRIGGLVSKVYVENNQYVEAGTPLFELDPEPYKIAVDAAKAAFDEAVDAVGANGAGVAAAAARVRQAEAAVTNARSDMARGKALKDAGNISAANLESREAAFKQAESGLAAAMAELDRAQQQYGQKGGENARLRAASAALRKAQLDLSYALVQAPASGWVSNVTLREGAMIVPGRQVFTLVEDGTWWVDAHFKETDIDRLKPGQGATILIDMYPDSKWTGIIESISAGSGAAFSLLPPENASGNWVKVTQRYTVRIKITNYKEVGKSLRIGASGRATVDARSGV